MYKIVPFHTVKHWIALFFIILPLFELSAQEEEVPPPVVKIKFDPLVDNIQDKLPPLEVLIDSAIKNAPLIRMKEAEISLSQYKLLELQHSWTKNLGFTSNFLYGNQYNYSTSETTGGLPSEFISTRASTYFTVGVFLKFPIFEIINQKNYVNQGKREIEASMINREEIIRTTKQDVIFTYQALLLHQDLLKVKNEAQVTSSLQVKMAEKEFLNGKISIAELARLTQTHSSNLYNYKQDRMLFYRQYLLLEQLVGIQFNLLNEIY